MSNKEKRKIVAEQWKSYAKSTLPTDCSLVQRTETKRAFYAGAQGVLFGIMEAMTPTADAEDGDVQMLQDIHDELLEFGRDVKEGRA